MLCKGDDLWSWLWKWKVPSFSAIEEVTADWAGPLIPEVRTECSTVLSAFLTWERVPFLALRGRALVELSQILSAFTSLIIRLLIDDEAYFPFGREEMVQFFSRVICAELLEDWIHAVACGCDLCPLYKSGRRKRQASKTGCSSYFFTYLMVWWRNCTFQFCLWDLPSKRINVILEEPFPDKTKTLVCLSDSLSITVPFDMACALPPRGKDLHVKIKGADILTSAYLLIWTLNFVSMGLFFN